MARAQYYQAGYTPPAGVNSATGVKEYQRMLGVDIDGIWGPKTQAAYDQYLAGQNTQSSASSSWRWGAPGSQDAAGQGGTDLFNRYYQTILGQLQVPTINLNIPSADAVRQQWQDALQPSLDAAISRRQSASQSIRAELDADAVSRGMGSSTYVSSLKERESAEAQEDIDELQAQYGATLAERIATSLQAYEQMRLNAQQYNLQAQAAAQQAALNMAGNWYSDYVAQQNALAQLQAKSSQSTSSGSRGSSGSSSGAKASSSLSADDYLTYVENLSSGQRKLLFSSGQSYWKVRREELEAALGSNAYQTLRRRYLGQ